VAQPLRKKFAIPKPDTNSYASIMKKILIIALGLLLLAGCGRNKFNPEDYVTYQPGNSFTYTGPMIVAIDSARTTPDGVEYIIMDVDANGQVLSREIYLKKGGQSWWKEFDGGGMGVPRFQFDPPVLASPFSDKVGAKYSGEGVEIRADGSRLRYRLEAEVVAVEEVDVPAAKFPACIKIRSAYTYLDTTSNPLISGEASRWFARGVGIVKYQMPNGIGELLEAKIGDRILPAKK
jgi:hypothetical protein